VEPQSEGKTGQESTPARGQGGDLLSETCIGSTIFAPSALGLIRGGTWGRIIFSQLGQSGLQVCPQTQCAVSLSAFPEGNVTQCGGGDRYVGFSSHRNRGKEKDLKEKRTARTRQEGGEANQGV